MFSLVTDLDLLRDKIKQVGDVKLVQIDPITAYLGSTNGKMDSYRTTDVRAVLAVAPNAKLSEMRKSALFTSVFLLKCMMPMTATFSCAANSTRGASAWSRQRLVRRRAISA
jgi:hypothetical protein